MRARLEDVPGGLRIVIPADRGWSTLWTTVWFAVFLYAGNDSLNPFQRHHGQDRVLYYSAFAMSALWLYGHVQGWLWALGGREVIEISSNAFVARNEYFGIGWTRRYDISEIHDLQYAPLAQNGSRDQIPEGIIFNYRGRLGHFGSGLQEAEVNHLLAAVQLRARAIGLTGQPEAKTL